MRCLLASLKICPCYVHHHRLLTLRFGSRGDRLDSAAGATSDESRKSRIKCATAFPNKLSVCLVGLPETGRLRLKRLALEQLRHLAEEAGGLADEYLLERRHAIDQPKADVPDKAQHVGPVRQEPVKPA